MQNYNPIMNYKEQAISTMSKGELIIALFDNALKNVNVSIIFMKDNKFNETEIPIEKAKKIFMYLCNILDNKYEISAELNQLYRFINQELIRAKVKKDYKILEEIVPIIDDLKDTWVQAEKLIHINKNK